MDHICIIIQTKNLRQLEMWTLTRYYWKTGISVKFLNKMTPWLFFKKSAYAVRDVRGVVDGGAGVVTVWGV